MPHSHHPLDDTGTDHTDHTDDTDHTDERVSIDDLMSDLRSSGQRATTARRAVLELLLEAGDRHLTAEELARGVGEQHPAIALSTIYRTLEALDEAGLISPARFADQSATYHLTDDVHHHAVCSTCGRTISLSPDVFEPVTSRLLEEFSFHADPRHLTITGLCDACAAA